MATLDTKKQWHPTKNGNLTEVTANPRQKVWWLCPHSCSHGCAHEWQSVVFDKDRYGCPFCSNKNICIHSSICYTHPDIAAQWHPTKNGSMKAEEFIAGSNKKVWWLCPNTCESGCIHEWESQISTRTSRGAGCRYCSSHNKSICIHNSLLYKFPELAKQWHPTKNGELTPDKVHPGSGKNAWWLCPITCSHGCLHEFESHINNRTGRGDGCAVCKNGSSKFCIHNSVVYTHPDILKQWHPTKNTDITPDKISYASDKKIWWLCPNTCNKGCKHEWLAPFSDRTRGQGCPYCCIPNKKSCEHMCISHTHPELVKEWHPTKNKDITPDKCIPGSARKVWWLCPNTCKEGCKHEYETSISSRTKLHTGCPFCGLQKTCIHDSIVYTHPTIAQQWHPSKNGTLKPSDFRAGSDCKKIWWLCEKTCPKGCIHEWEAVVYSRTSQGCGCPHCSNRRQTCEHVSIKYTHPEIVKEWHPTKNIHLCPTNFMKSSQEKLWWICDRGHEFEQRIAKRCNRGQGCPICKNKTATKLYDYLLAKYPQLKREIKLESCKYKKHLPFDFCIPEINSIIELDGMQHFKQIRLWNNDIYTSLKRDVFKMQKAEKEGYKVIRISQEDVYTNTKEWLDEHLLPELISDSRDHVCISTIDTMYDMHIELLQSGTEIVLEGSEEELSDS